MSAPVSLASFLPVRKPPERVAEADPTNVRFPSKADTHREAARESSGYHRTFSASRRDVYTLQRQPSERRLRITKVGHSPRAMVKLAISPCRR